MTLAVMGTEAVARATARLRVRLLAARAIDGAAIAAVVTVLAAEVLTVVATGLKAKDRPVAMARQITVTVVRVAVAVLAGATVTAAGRERAEAAMAVGVRARA